jgi:hypothetical protein
MADLRAAGGTGHQVRQQRVIGDRVRVKNEAFQPA